MLHINVVVNMDVDYSYIVVDKKFRGFIAGVLFYLETLYSTLGLLEDIRKLPREKKRTRAHKTYLLRTVIA